MLVMHILNTKVCISTPGWLEAKLGMNLQKKDVWLLTKKKRDTFQGIYITEKKEVNKKFGRKINKDVDGSRKLF